MQGIKGGTFWRPVRFGTCGELQWIGRVGGQKGRGPLERCAPCQSALSECHWEGPGRGGLRTIDFRQLPRYYPTGAGAVFRSRVREFLFQLQGSLIPMLAGVGKGGLA